MSQWARKRWREGSTGVKRDVFKTSIYFDYRKSFVG